MLCGDFCGAGGHGLGSGFMRGRVRGPRCCRRGGPASTHIHPLTALDPDLVVVADGRQLVPVQAYQPHHLVAHHVLLQLCQRRVREALCPALHLAGALTELIPFGSQILKSVKISTVYVRPRIAAIDPVSPVARLF